MLIEKIKTDRMSAMKDKNTASKNLLTTLLGELEGKAKRDQVDISDDMVVASCQKFMKNNSETMDHLGDSSNEAFVALEKENEVLSNYLPKQLTAERLGTIISELDTKNIGAIMKHLNSTYNGQFDRGLAAKLAKAL